MTLYQCTNVTIFLRNWGQLLEPGSAQSHEIHPWLATSRQKHLALCSMNKGILGTHMDRRSTMVYGNASKTIFISLNYCSGLGGLEAQ